MSKISEYADGGALQSDDALVAARGTGNVKITTLRSEIDGKEDSGIAAAAVAAHEGASDPHTGYLTAAEADAAYEAAGAVADHEAAADPHPGYLTPAEGNAAYVPVTRTVAGKALSSNVTLVKGDVGLGNVDNTSDAAKPVSTATQTALDAKLNTIASAADGDIIIRSGSAWTRLAKGTDGQVLKLASGLPAWGTDSEGSGGADPWTYLILPGDHTMSSTTVANIANGGVTLGFTPEANTRYIIEGILLLRTATTTVNPRVGWAWSTGLSDGVMSIDQAQSATAQLMSRGNPAAALLIAVGGLASNSASWPAYLYGIVMAGATPSGLSRAQISTETAGTNVTVRAGSFIRYRTY